MLCLGSGARLGPAAARLISWRRASARRNLLARRAQCGLQLLVRVALHRLCVLQPLDELHLLLLHLRDEGIGATTEHLLLRGPRLVVLPELLELRKALLLQLPSGLLLPRFDQITPVHV